MSRPNLAADTEALATDLSDAVAAIRRDLAQVIETVGSLSKNRVQAAGDAARSEVAHLRDVASDKAAALQHRASVLTTDTADLIRRNPGTSLAVVAGVGLLFGLLMSRR